MKSIVLKFFIILFLVGATSFVSCNDSSDDNDPKIISDVVTPSNGGIVSDPKELRIYQVMVASFQDGDETIGYTDMWGPNKNEALKGGDLQGIINALDYIKELGCNAIWMTPIFDSDGVYEKLAATGYFATDYFNVDPHFGTNEKFKELVTTAHEKNISVLLDGVFGHNGGSERGDNNVWAEMKPSPSVQGVQNPGTCPSTVNPVNYTDVYTRNYYFDVARYWIEEYKIDGYRLDQCYQVGLGETGNGDKCTTGGHNYWYDIRKIVETSSAKNGKKGQDWGTLGYMVGEHWNGDASIIQKGSINSGTAAGFGLQSCFDFPSYYHLMQAFAHDNGKYNGNIGNSLSYTYSTYSQKGYVCKEDSGFYKPYYPNLMLSNHDLYRVGDLIKQKFNCDYVTDEYVKRNSVLIAAQCAYTGPITIYYGDEIGDHSADLTRNNGSNGGWNPDNVARSTGKIKDFNSQEKQLHDWTSRCLNSRAEHTALWGGSNTEIKKSASFYVAKKVYETETIYIAFNYGNTEQSFEINGTGEDLLSSTSESFTKTVTVPALSARYVLMNN